MSSATQGQTKYLVKLIFTIAFLSSLVFSVNWFVDPLWYNQGNQFFPENYSFNERYSKVNAYLKSPQKFDCILFGSSRTTLLDATQIRSHHCYNFSFSDGIPPEFIHYANYIKTFGSIPDLVIVGIDGRNFSRNAHANQTPDFVLDLEIPPSVITTYLSFDAFVLSVRTLLGDSPQPRFYTDTFIGDILPNAPAFEPPSCFSDEGFAKPYTLEQEHFLVSLRSIFPKAKFIGYVTPVSAWDMLAPHQDKTLPTYLETIYGLSDLFDDFYDFSIPSRVTKRADNTYDGQHYSRAVNDRIARILDGSSPDFGISLHDRDYVEYKDEFNRAMRNFADTQGGHLQFNKKCARKSTMR